jgi:hypothetical protein
MLRWMIMGRFAPLLLAIIGVAVGSVAGACSSSEGDSASTNRACGVAVDRFKELMIVDDAVINDARTRNETAGVWSFRHAVEAALPAGANASSFLAAWLEDWESTKQVNGFTVDKEPRRISTTLVCPWLQATPQNQCDATCGTCVSRNLDLAKAPFRLIAIVNRMDLRGHPGATSPAGEGRLVFAMTRGPGDDAASMAMPSAVIFEYALPKSMDAEHWAQTWHHLGTHAAIDEAYKTELAEVTERYVGRGVSPERVNGSALAQVRTNESAFNWIWQLRQFELDASGNLRLAPVANTPGEPLNNSTLLRDFVKTNREKILAGQHVLPRSMTGGSADQLLFRWNVPEVDDTLRRAFAHETCNGCHADENTPVDTAFHVSPFRSGVAKLSRFVNDPQDPTKDDLAKREASMRTALCKNE